MRTQFLYINLVRRTRQSAQPSADPSRPRLRGAVAAAARLRHRRLTLPNMLPIAPRRRAVKFRRRCTEIHIFEYWSLFRIPAKIPTKGDRRRYQKHGRETRSASSDSACDEYAEPIERHRTRRTHAKCPDSIASRLTRHHRRSHPAQRAAMGSRSVTLRPNGRVRGLDSRQITSPEGKQC